MNFVKMGGFIEACQRTVRVCSRPKILGTLRECQQCFCGHLYCQSHVILYVSVSSVSAGISAVSHTSFAKYLLELNVLEQKS